MLNRINTMGFATSALLAMTTSAFALALPPGGITVTGEVSLEESNDRPVATAIGLSAHPHDVFRISVTNAAEFFVQVNAANFASSSPGNTFVALYSGDKELLPGSFVPWDIILGGTPGDALNFTSFSEGEYTLVYGSDYPVIGDGVGTYTFTLFGATFLDILAAIEEVAGDQASVAANEIAQALSASIFSAVKTGLQSAAPVVSRNVSFGGVKNRSGRTWFQADYTAIDGTDLEGRFPILQGGIDFQLENGMLLGAALGYSDFSVRNTASDLKGESLTIQPYLGFQLGKTTGSISLSFGQLDLDTADGNGSAEGDTRGINLSLERGFALGGQQLIGEFDAGFGRQDIDSGTGTLAALADTHSTWSYASLGARYEMQNGNVNSSIGGSIDYNDVGNLDNLSASHYGSDGFTGAINVSFDYNLNNGSNVYFKGEVGGLGGDAIRKSVQAGIDFRF